jgi:glycosyltransferase involved in cell wall biosynthesis
MTISMDYSVVIPAYNREASIRRSVLSVLHQQPAPREVIVVDDASTDSTVELARSIDGVKVVSLEKNSGANHARNVGVDHSSANWIAFQDSDDMWLPHKSEVIARTINECPRETRWLFSRFFRVSHQRVRFAPEAMGGTYSNSWHLLTNVELNLFARVNLASTQTMFVQRHLFNEVGGFDRYLPRFQDWDLALRLLNRSLPAVIDEPLVAVYVSENSISKDFQAGIDARERMLAKGLSQLSPGQPGRKRFVFDLAMRKLASKDIGGAVQGFVQSIGGS